MVLLREVQKFTKVGSNPLLETVTAAARVLVGYDDDLGVWYVHDPSFGPALEVSYTDMKLMQEPVDVRGIVFFPEHYQEIVALRQSAGAYRARTPAERAAWAYVNGYANAATGELKAAEARLRDGLAIADAGKGYQFLLRYELALVTFARGNKEEALTLAEEATRLVPEHPGPWRLISDVCDALSRPELKTARDDAAQRWPVLAKDQAAGERLAAALPADFLINYLVPYRGWGGDVKLSPDIEFKKVKIP
jgi:tetratricopeptide (TPR) repeat protein